MVPVEGNAAPIGEIFPRGAAKPEAVNLLQAVVRMCVDIEEHGNVLLRYTRLVHYPDVTFRHVIRLGKRTIESSHGRPTEFHLNTDARLRKC
jgi:hypothetical protein